MDYNPAKFATSEQLEEQRKKLKDFLSDPKNVADVVKELKSAGLFRGNVQYDDFVRSARRAAWYDSIKDMTFTDSQFAAYR